jgi:hypothetical protein
MIIKAKFLLLKIPIQYGNQKTLIFLLISKPLKKFHKNSHINSCQNRCTLMYMYVLLPYLRVLFYLWVLAALRARALRAPVF